MIVPNKLTLLGSVCEIVYHKKHDEYKIDFGKNKPLLLSNKKNNVLYVLQIKLTKRISYSATIADIRNHTMWSGHEMIIAHEVKVPTVTLKIIGDIKKIIYESDKYDHKKNLYEHGFKKQNRFYADKNNTHFAIKHNKARPLWNARGLIS